ncbi:Zn(II)2Cys6 transcription factor domain-containing protein [Aspergillus mulundensis]|uniref:Zn(2)-C6 fungal-type domain-containing protein n=1 Tax=Aspergillus mulundensis TaxID=1810919 RepID=A0A3D8RXT8_9EURO|nr:Uncharacterized protein DSM5745_05725 [Aspergillus mulundensis]RDW78873.1 Uncharacterized protein DSM5745_05725 [Aspergillus mulundensis]
MPQRAHKKSRNGCLECKRRHVRCDERQPICSNCATAERVCGYGTRSLTAAPRSILPGSRAQLALTRPESPAGDHSPAPPAIPNQPVNMLHIELFHNLYTHIRTTFDPNRSIPWLADDMDPSMMTPYLVNELLAFSALHLSIKCPNQQAYFRYHAAELQTNALSIFKESAPQVTRESCIPLFIFAATLGIHMLCDTLIYRQGDLPDFLARFVHFFRVYHGVRTIVNKAWHMIQDTPLGPSFAMGKDLYAFTGCLGHTCQSLLDRIDRANLGEHVTGIYRQAVEGLQSCATVIEKWDERHVGINAVTTWPILMDIEFGEFLEQRRPEALVILAHYACLLHRFRNFWLFGDSGAFVIREVTGYLGPEWEDWMVWPNQVLGSSAYVHSL